MIRSLLNIFVLTFIALCAPAHHAYAVPYDDTGVTKRQLVSMIERWKDPLSRKIALATIRNATKVRLTDNHGHWSAQYRINNVGNGMGSCVHYDPRKRQAYLEIGFSKREYKRRRDAGERVAPKYIQWGGSGPWYWRMHSYIDGVRTGSFFRRNGIEINLKTRDANAHAREILVRLDRYL